ncbi:MAG: transglycosylase SLT domain-containing protein [Candidatus Magasanikbacteria bacterium]|nr:transglycosylase SLT domain-containing protein [Candidatus Magasanikbacteria bacterium]
MNGNLYFNYNMKKIIFKSVFIFVSFFIFALLNLTPVLAQNDIEDLQENIRVPETQINIPGLEFSDADLEELQTKDIGPFGRLNTYYYFPYFGEYLAAVYKYTIGAIAIIAVIVLIISGLQWASSAGNDEMINSAKKRIIGAVMGLVIAVSSYTILYIINPDLVQFNNIKVLTVVGEDVDLENAVYDGKQVASEFITYNADPSRALSDSQYDEIFKSFANCIDADWRLLKVMAYKESRLRKDIKNKEGFIGLFQTKPNFCRSALRNYPQWAGKCNDLTDPYVNTAVGAMMLKTGLAKLNKCPSLSTVDQGILIYLNHNSGGGAVNWMIKNGACGGGNLIEETIIAFWDQHKNGRYKGQEKGQKRYKFAVGVSKLFLDQGVTNFKDTSQNGDFRCPLTEYTSDVASSLKNVSINCDDAFNGRKVLAIGDSNIANSSSFVEKMDTACPNVEFEKKAYSGEDAGDLWKKIEDGTIDLSNYNDVIIWIGVNDLDNATRDLEKIYREARDKNLRVIAITLTPWKDYGSWTEQRQLKTDEINTWIKNDGGGFLSGQKIIDAYYLLEDPKNPDYLNPLYQRDLIHINNAGHELLAKLIAVKAF